MSSRYQAEPHKHYTTCTTTGKRGYESRKNAKVVTRLTDKGMRVYRCDDCDLWHIGHVAPGKSREAMRRYGREYGDDT